MGKVSSVMLTPLKQFSSPGLMKVSQNFKTAHGHTYLDLGQIKNAIWGTVTH